MGLEAMRKLLSLLVALFAVVPAAGAENLEYCYSADRAAVAGDYARAITDFTRCLSEGDLTGGHRYDVTQMDL